MKTFITSDSPSAELQNIIHFLNTLTDADKLKLALDTLEGLGCFGVTYFTESDINTRYRNNYSDYINFNGAELNLSPVQIKEVRAKIEEQLNIGVAVDGYDISCFITDVINDPKYCPELSAKDEYFTFQCFGREIGSDVRPYGFKRRFKANSYEEAESKLLAEYQCDNFYRV